MARLWLWLLAAWLPFQAWAEPPGDPLSWVGRIATAGQKLTYVGTFTYQSGARLETSRIIHVRDGGGELEKLETLDGSPREVIRSSTGEVRCVLPTQKTVIIDQAGGRRVFPSRLVEGWTGLAENYRIRRGELGRVAGLEAQQIVLEPKDDLRYAQILWADLQSGLLLKSRLVDEQGETIEQFAFNEVKIGGEVDRAQLQSRYGGEQAGWHVLDARGNELRGEGVGWGVRNGLPGFRQTSIVRRQLGPGNEAVQMVFSDGLVAISVFVEPLPTEAAKAATGAFRSGAINIFKRALGSSQVTALGEVPPRAVQRLAEAVEPLKR
ncbi:MAG: MucB/RseB C-terminal domain-containing protein [Rhodocyclaceae bacterium]|jgi:sigma-E factor negative regulatory protein RseB|nr:MucB/RseB C-terminal domain-containing protein [Rhodocyclaceae bacterium]